MEFSNFNSANLNDNNNNNNQNLMFLFCVLEKVATGLAGILEDITIGSSDDYNFETDFKSK